MPASHDRNADYPVKKGARSFERAPRTEVPNDLSACWLTFAQSPLQEEAAARHARQGHARLRARGARYLQKELDAVNRRRTLTLDWSGPLGPDRIELSN